MARSSDDSPIVPTVHGEVVSALEMSPGVLAHNAADRLAALTARAAGAPSAMIHLAEAPHLRLVGGWGLPEGWRRMETVPAPSTLAGLVIHYGFAVVVGDVRDDPRVPPDAPVRLVGIRAYAGFPVRDPRGDVVGVCAVMDYEPREWQGAELAAVDEGAQACTTFVAEQWAWQHAERQRIFLDTLLDSLDTGVMACDEQGRLVVVNNALRRALGIEPTDEPPDEWTTRLPLTHPNGAAFTMRDLPLLRATAGRQVRDVDTVAQTRAGGQRLYSVNAHPMERAAGQRLGAVSVFHDVTERRRAELFRGCELMVTRALNESGTIDQAAPRVLEAIAGTLGWPYAELWLVDHESQVLRFCDRYQAPGFDCDAHPPDELRPEEGFAGIAWDRTDPVWWTDTDGTEGHALPRAAACALRTALALPIPSGGVTLAVMTLFTDRLEHPQRALVTLLSGVAAHIGQFIERRRAEQLQRALSASKDDYLNLVGHELRTPLTIISSYIELVCESDRQTRLAELEPMVEAIRRGSERLRRLVEALLDLSELDSGRTTIKPQPIDLAALVAHAVEEARAAARAKDVTLTAHLPERLPATGDPERLAQLTRALLDNAVIYTPGGGRVDVRLSARGRTAELTVSDTGVGVPEDERAHVFQRFFRGAVATELSIPGAGLGLATAQLIAQRHGGEITLDENPDGRRGSTFRLCLPLTKDEEAEPSVTD